MSIKRTKFYSSLDRQPGAPKRPERALDQIPPARSGQNSAPAETGAEAE